MGRKKKDEKFMASVDRPFNPDTDMPTIIDTTSLDDTYRRTIVDRHSPYTITRTSTGDTYIDYPYPLTAPTGLSSGYAHHWGSTTIYPGESVIDVPSWKELMKKREREEVGDVDVMSEEPFKGQHLVKCTNPNDLSVERILKTLSAVKGKLMIDTAVIRIKNFECKMTPAVKRHIVTASKKLKMYGKKPPIIARFDDYGRPLPDVIDFDTMSGVALEIVDPQDYGEYYLELKAIEFRGDSYIHPDDVIDIIDDLPF